MTDHPESADSTALPESSSFSSNDPRVSALGGVAERAGHSTLAEESVPERHSSFLDDIGGLLADLNAETEQRVKLARASGYIAALADVACVVRNGRAVTGDDLHRLTEKAEKR